MENITKMTKWAEDCFLAKSYSIKNRFEPIRTTPWSGMARYVTSEGFVYLKRTPPTLSLEPIIIQILREKFQASVPIVLDINTALHCFLMKDSGKPLREIFKSDLLILIFL